MIQLSTPASCGIRGRLVATALLAAMGLPRGADAELPSIRFDRITPLGVAAGTTVEVEIAGADIEGVEQLLFDHPGLSAAPVAGKERRFAVQAAPQVPAGTYDVRLVGRWGVSNPRLLSVSHGLADVAEAEPNNSLDQAQLVAVNSAIDGSSDANNEDSFRFQAEAGQRIVLDCQAGKLDSMMDATMSLAASDGKLIASNSDYNGRDPLIDFVAAEDGEYVVRVFDLSYRGGFPYRLLITTLPDVEAMHPLAAQAGTDAKLSLLGRPMGVLASPSAGQEDGRAAPEQTFSFTPPDDLLPRGRFSFIEHPTTHSVLPTAATCTLTGVQFRPLESGRAQTLLITDTPVILESEPNDQPDHPQAAALPLTVSGRFDRPRDADWYEFEVPESAEYAFDVYCERVNGHADPYLVVMDDRDQRINELDDFGHRINAFDGHLRDPSGMMRLDKGRKYRVLVQDRYRRGGVRYQYVLAVRPRQPDFYVAVIHSQNPGPGGTTLWRGGATSMDVVVHQQHGYNGPVTLTAEHLPPGVHMPPTTLTNNSRGTLVFWADDEAQDFVGPVALTAVGERDGQRLEREVRPYCRVWNDAGMNSSRPTRELIVAVRDGAPFRLQWDRVEVEVVAGTELLLKLKLVRRWPGFAGDVSIQALAFPGNFKLANSSFKGDQAELEIALTVQDNTQPGRYTLAVLGQAQVPFNKDPEAEDRPNTLVSMPSLPLTLVVAPAAP